MVHTWLEISKEAFYHNIESLKKIIGETKLGCMLKADAYGHGLLPMAKLAQEHPDVEYIFTALSSEALQLRSLGITKPICVLVLCDNCLEEVIMHDIEMIFYDPTSLILLAEAAKKVGKPARIHIKIDSGMSRLGILPNQIDSVFNEIKKYPHIQVVGVMTHLSDADDVSQASLDFTQHQLHVFETIVQQAGALFPESLQVVHACASAGTLFFHKRFSLVRVGEVSYDCQRLVRVATNAFGYFKPTAQRLRCEASNIDFSLRPVLTWKTRIIQVKQIPAGSFVGYSRTYRAERTTTIAMLPVGYFYGYPRGLSNCGVVLLRGKLVPVIGRVSMNLCTIDVTEVPDVTLHDEVILLGDHEGITADDLAKKVGTINLNILTGLHASIPRIIV